MRVDTVPVAGAVGTAVVGARAAAPTAEPEGEARVVVPTAAAEAPAHPAAVLRGVLRVAAAIARDQLKEERQLKVSASAAGPCVRTAIPRKTAGPSAALRSG